MPIPQTIRADRRARVTVPRTQQNSFPGDTVTLGVSTANFPREGKVLQRTRASSKPRSMAGKFRTLLTNYQFDWDGIPKFEADHVQDLGFDGEDHLDNLWPLDRDDNRDANVVYRQEVAYERAGRKITTIPLRLIGKFFEITKIETPPR